MQELDTAHATVAKGQKNPVVVMVECREKKWILPAQSRDRCSGSYSGMPLTFGPSQSTCSTMRIYFIQTDPAQSGSQRHCNTQSFPPTLSRHPQYRTVPPTKSCQKHNSAFQFAGRSSSGRISMSPSFSESLILESQEFTMHQSMRMTTIPEATPTKARVSVVVFWKENSNRAIKNTKTLDKLVIVTIWRKWNHGCDARPHQQSIR